MVHVGSVFILFSINCVFVICLIPTLNVQKLDQRLIAKKRQDTLDMCRIFTVENEKMSRAYSLSPWQNGGKRRYKRDTTAPTSIDAANIENVRRVEHIVDKLYEDVVEDGEPVTYRHRNIETLTSPASVQNTQNKTMRRFNFAPAELLGPLPTYEPSHTEITDGEAAGIDWPKKWKHGIVPYFIDSKTYDAHLAEIIMDAFEYVERATCIRLQRLKDRPTDKDSLQNVEWLYITNPAGIRQCVHTNERKTNKGVQMVVFGYDCLSTGEIIHEVMHILGFSHEHTRPDRDQYITILWNNIKPGYRKYFETRSSDTLLNIPYDHASVLHYPPRAFSKNGQVTIKAATGIKLGQRQGLSEGDVEKIAVIYGSECVKRNRQYLLKTCPSVVRANTESTKVSREEVVEYFRDRLWPYGIVNYKIKDAMEFSAEEKENIRAVIRHIEKETCIQFRDISAEQYETDVENQHTSDWGGGGHNQPIHPLKQTGSIETGDTASPSEDNTDNNAENRVGNDKTTNKGTRSDTDNTNPLKPYDTENVVKSGDDVDDDMNKIPSNSENENSLRMGTAIPRSNNIKLKRSRKFRVEKSQRRHAADILVLVRSIEPGCRCPAPGKPNGNKVLKINADCFNSVNDLLHLFVHLLGLDHQHNMHDRDSYLHILWDNLTPDIREEMSVKLPPAASLGFDYDYQSVMHYPWLQIKNGVTNIMYPIWNDGWAMGHWQGLSSTDVMKLNLLYFDQCLERKNNMIIEK